MEEQSGREFTSADPTAGAQDATLQERGLSPEVPLNPRRRLQHFQRHCHVREFYLSTPLRTQRPHQGKSIIWSARRGREIHRKWPILAECDNAFPKHFSIDEGESIH